MNRRSKFHYLLLLSLSVGMFGCKKESAEESSTFSGTAAKTAGIVNKAVANNGDTYTVDVFYFIPRGTTPVENYQARINNLTDFTKTWFNNQLATRSNLYANSLLDFTAANGNVTINIITGKFEAVNYNGTAGLAAADAEIDAYIAVHPSIKHSAHSLVYLPGTAPMKLVTNTTVGSCRTRGKKRVFEVDFPGYDSASQNSEFNTAYGSFLHELGHAFNLNHNKVTPTLAKAKGGVSLMSFKLPVFSDKLYLSPTDIEILTTCQVFNKKGSIAYYEQLANFNLTNFEALDATIMHDGSVSFGFQSDIPVKSIVFYNDPASTGTSEFSDVSDCDAVSSIYVLSSAKLEGTINQTFPLNDFYNLTSGKKHRMRIGLVLENGTMAIKDLYYLTNGSETIGWADMLPSNLSSLDKSRWQVIAMSSEKELDPVNGPAKLLIDNNRGTAWLPSTVYSNGRSYPSEVLIDCGKVLTANTFILSQIANTTQMPAWGLEFQVQVSDDGVHFRVAGDFDSYRCQTLGHIIIRPDAREYFKFTSPQTFRYFKLVTKRGHDFVIYKKGGFYRMIDYSYPVVYNAPSYLSEIGLLNQ